MQVSVESGQICGSGQRLRLCLYKTCGLKSESWSVIRKQPIIMMRQGHQQRTKVVLVVNSHSKNQNLIKGKRPTVRKKTCLTPENKVLTQEHSNSLIRVPRNQTLNSQ